MCYWLVWVEIHPLLPCDAWTSLFFLLLLLELFPNCLSFFATSCTSRRPDLSVTWWELKPKPWRSVLMNDVQSYPGKTLLWTQQQHYTCAFKITNRRTSLSWSSIDVLVIWVQIKCMRVWVCVCWPWSSWSYFMCSFVSKLRCRPIHECLRPANSISL